MDSGSAASFTPSAIYFTWILHLRPRFTYLKQKGFSVSRSLHVTSSLCQASMTSCQISKTPSYPASISEELVLTNLSQDGLYFSFISLITHCYCSVAQLCLTVCDPMDCSTTQWTWVWASSGRWWWTGKPGVLQSMGLQRVRQDWATEKQQYLRAQNLIIECIYPYQSSSLFSRFYVFQFKKRLYYVWKPK